MLTIGGAVGEDAEVRVEHPTPHRNQPGWHVGAEVVRDRNVEVSLVHITRMLGHYEGARCETESGPNAVG